MNNFKKYARALRLQSPSFFVVSLCLGFLPPFFEKKGGAKKLSIRKFLWYYIVRSGFAIAESELYFLKQMQLSASFVQREVARDSVTEGLFFQISVFLPLYVTMASKAFIANMFFYIQKLGLCNHKARAHNANYKTFIV